MPRGRTRGRPDYRPHVRSIRIPLVTERSVFDACDALSQAGAIVSVRAVRDRLRGGSFRDLTAAIKRWRDQHRQREIARADQGFQPGALGAPAAYAAAPASSGELTAIRAALAQASYETRALEQRLTQQLAADFADLRQRFAQENAALKTALDEARAERDALARQHAQTIAKLAAIEARRRVRKPRSPKAARRVRRSTAPRQAPRGRRAAATAPASGRRGQATPRARRTPPVRPPSTTRRKTPMRKIRTSSAKAAPASVAATPMALDLSHARLRLRVGRQEHFVASLSDVQASANGTLSCEFANPGESFWPNPRGRMQLSARAGRGTAIWRDDDSGEIEVALEDVRKTPQGYRGTWHEPGDAEPYVFDLELSASPARPRPRAPKSIVTAWRRDRGKVRDARGRLAAPRRR
jgi:hypothetical protein